MREYYSTRIIKEDVKSLDITKKMIVQLFIDPRTNQPHDSKKRGFCMDWCTFQ
jgi:hypothetical protein